MADILQFPVTPPPRRSCEDCENAYHGAAGVFCRLYKEEIWDEVRTAESCEDFDPVPWAPTGAKEV